MPLRIEKPVTLYTIEEARKVIGVSQPTLWKAVRDGKLPAIKYGHYFFIAEEDLLRWKAEHYRADLARRKGSSNQKRKKVKRRRESLRCKE